MEGIRLGFKLRDLAVKRKMGIGSFELKDGTTVSLLNDFNKRALDFYRTKSNYLLGAKGYRGSKNYQEAIGFLTKLAGEAKNSNEVCRAWSDSLRTIAIV